ncbi:radical SAM additional 4Fe4S-binding SPASM domain-containing protein [Marinitoga hydrogenitolerans DSM 16785]|uniref:Radical SAM additional 4Fe4S-binding SPASM domain-containing protein n=1 Tax=Marinitoga hydrogenitolerans (strain DSM 16785 / JCM 12826 / AT1271) TaxID=1122195 RepID=A0A1M4Y906_MARH1|nr:radical SAM protein [Marinitoga hydrogenitolerans]SHF02083.1 radical SAM additional 4Fe4S-binding SPASM domain-containing protein [Marinitoga hydrogenitolerans DSM 16785]
MAHWRKDCISIFLTDRCNLHCKYCYCNEIHKNTQIENHNINFYKIGITDFYLSHGYIYLRFFANGEPTLQIDIIKELVEYSKFLTNNVKFELQTNGVFNKKISKWISENIDIVWISCDGMPKIQDYYRPTLSGNSSSKIVESNIKYLTNNIKYLGVRITIGQKNIFGQKELIDYFDSLNVKYLYSDLIFLPINMREKDFFEEKIPPLIYAREYLKAHKYAQKKGIFYGSYFIINFDEKTSISCRACNPSPHLTIDGYVTACDMSYKKDVLSDLVYGKYDNEKKRIIYDYNKIEKIRSRIVDNMKECSNCEIKYFCAGGCLGESLNELGDLFKPKRHNCEAIKFLAKELKPPLKQLPIFHP